MLMASVLRMRAPTVDFFDASGTLFAMANFIYNFIPGKLLPI